MSPKFLLVMGLGITASYAGKPVWTIVPDPSTNTNISVPSNGSYDVIYTITNQSKRGHSIVLQPMKGLSITSTNFAYCSNPISLGGGESCKLLVNISGAQLNGSFAGGPVLCQQDGFGFECYQPKAENMLNVTLTGQQTTQILQDLPSSGPASGGGTVTLTGTGLTPQSGGSVTVVVDTTTVPSSKIDVSCIS